MRKHRGGRKTPKFSHAELRLYSQTHRIKDTLKKFKISLQTYYGIVDSSRRVSVYDKKAGIIAKGINQYNDPYVFDFGIMIKACERAGL